MSDVTTVRLGSSPVRVVQVVGGAPGATMNWRGAWSSDGVFAPLDAASDAGSSYLCTAAVGPSATHPASDGTHWALLAEKGTDGIDGTGTMNGPASAVDGHMAVFDGITGKLLRDGGAPLVIGTTSSTAMAGDKQFATTTQGTKADTAIQPSVGIVYVNHGSTAATARPAGAAVVYWYGTVEPTNMVAGDLGYGWTA